MALLTLAGNPELFRAVGAFVPITDMIAWHEYSGYRTHIEACLGTPPVGDGIALYKERSPISYIDELSRGNLKIFHGKFDKVVPFRQSVDLYNLACEKYPESRIFLDVFDGTHEMDMESAFFWLTSQLDKKEKTAVTG